MIPVSVTIWLGTHTATAKTMMHEAFRECCRDDDARIIKDCASTATVRGGAGYNSVVVWAGVYEYEDCVILRQWLEQKLMPFLWRHELALKRRTGTEREWSQSRIPYTVTYGTNRETLTTKPHQFRG